ncbi:mechanosensitive ion channel family protein [Nocardioides okcheonensis]|uniref:mechanosensitive ion channel family protein n=1 Tax=Nocardioides okcheonensis TaxID=2894081 RepID=UPI001E46D003|nr:hypothetical protein [Nocardioides okcheonensis]UFN45149.1 hypothetical protein LN652_02730 [Nocardioides okcheonensis]
MDIGDSLQNTTDGIFDFLPNLVGFLLILLFGYLISKVVAGIVGKLLDKVHIDRHLHDSSARRYVDSVLPGASPANGIARIVFWFIFIFFITAAIGALGIPAATGFMNDVLAYLPNVIVAILIFVIAALLSGAIAGAVVKFMGDTPTGEVVGTVAPAVIVTIAFFMILEQLQIAPEIVRIAFTAIMFALALGLALAFGLGGRDLAADMLRQAKDKSSDAASQAKHDARVGAERARGEYEQSPSTPSTTPRTTAGGTHDTDEAITSDRAFDPEATQHMPPPASPNR